MKGAGVGYISDPCPFSSCRMGLASAGQEWAYIFHSSLSALVPRLVSRS